MKAELAGEGLQEGSRRDQDRLDGRADAGGRQRDDQPRPSSARTSPPAASRSRPRKPRLLEEHRQATAHLYCHGCGHLCETAAKGVPVADRPPLPPLLRGLRQARAGPALYQALPPDARDIADADLAAAEAACPYGLPVADLLRTGRPPAVLNRNRCRR